MDQKYSHVSCLGEHPWPTFILARKLALFEKLRWLKIRDIGPKSCWNTHNNFRPKIWHANIFGSPYQANYRIADGPSHFLTFFFSITHSNFSIFIDQFEATFEHFSSIFASKTDRNWKLMRFDSLVFKSSWKFSSILFFNLNMNTMHAFTLNSRIVE